MNMYCSDAEEILSQRCPEFYRAFKKKHENDDSVVFPIPDDRFDCSEAPTPERMYWENQLRTHYRDDYELYRVCSELNAFVFYVGCAVYETDLAVAAELGNYKALRQQYKATPSEDLAWRIRDFYPQAGDILRAKFFCEKLRSAKLSSKEHAETVEHTLGALDCAFAYDPKKYACCVKYDPSLALPVGDLLNEFLTKKLIMPKDLERRDCARFLKQENDGKEHNETKTATLAF